MGSCTSVLGSEVFPSTPLYYFTRGALQEVTLQRYLHHQIQKPGGDKDLAAVSDTLGVRMGKLETVQRSR